MTQDYLMMKIILLLSRDEQDYLTIKILLLLSRDETRLPHDENFIVTIS